MDKKIRIPMAFCMAAAWIFFIHRYVGIFFETNDDRLISEIFSGAMTGTPEAHAYYVDYILGFILSLLYRMTTAVPWYGGMLVLFQFLCWLRMRFLAAAKADGTAFLQLCAALSCMLPDFMSLPGYSLLPRPRFSP